MTDIIEIQGKIYLVMTQDELKAKLHGVYISGAFNQMLKIRDLQINGD